jgi:hypothetical protein
LGEIQEKTKNKEGGNSVNKFPYGNLKYVGGGINTAKTQRR